MRKLAALAFALSSLALFAERNTAIYRGKLTSDLNANGNRITSVGLPLDAGDAANKEYVDSHGGGGGCDTNAVDILANSAVVTNALTVATTNRIAALESSKADKSALTAHTENTNNPHGVTAAQVGAVSILPEKSDEIIFNWVDTFGTAIRLYTPYYETGIGLSTSSDGGELLNYHDDTYDWYQFPTGESGTLALTKHISATNPTFSNAVLAVQISTNDFAALYALKEAFADLPIDPVTGGISIGALLAALASAVAWLKKNKVGSFASVGGASATVENGVAKLGDFFTESNSLLTGTIDARLPYPLNTDGTIKDRAVNVVTSGAFVIPEGFKDLLIRYTGVPTSLTFSGTDASIADYGDDLPTETGDYLITVSRIKAAECYIRIIKLESRA